MQQPVVPPVKIEGRLLEKGTRKPLPDVNVYCFPESSPDRPLKTVTDSSGRFFFDLPAGAFKWVVSATGYVRLERQDKQRPEEVNKPRVLYLSKTSYLSYETTVYGQSEKRDDKSESLTQAQFLSVPGAGGDPVKAVQNLPGVNRTSAFSSQIIIEGSSPNDTRYNIDNQIVPIIFHFGGFTSVVQPEAVERVDYLTAGFGPEYGQSIAGFVNLKLRDPQTDRTHGFAFVDLMNAGGMVEGPIDDHSSYLVGVRQSYIGAVLGAVAGNNKDLSLTAVPDFKDTVLEYRNKIGPDDTFKIVGVGSQDTFGFLLKQPLEEDPGVRGSFSLKTRFFRVIPEWTHQYSPTVTGRFSMGLGKDWNDIDLGDLYIRAEERAASARAEVEDQINDVWKSWWGIDTQDYDATVGYQLPIVYSQGGVSNPIGTAEMRTFSGNYFASASGFYWRNEVRPRDSRWTYIPGARVSFNYFNGKHELLAEPRVAARYALDRGLTLRAAAGQYHEAPPLQDFDKNYGNPDLTSQRAIHGSVGFEKDFREGSATGWTVTNDFFYKRLYDLVAASTAYNSPSQPEYFNNSGYGRIYGMEFLGKYRSSGWEGWIAYTLSRSTHGDAQTPETLSQYDQTHIFTAVGDVEFGNNWKFSTRIRYTTGSLYTPITGGVFDVDNDVYIPIRGEVYSRRMEPFFQADARFDKKWIYDKWILTGYLDIENVTNRKNPQQVNYSYDYRQSATVTGLPIFPLLGVKAEF